MNLMQRYRYYYEKEKQVAIVLNKKAAKLVATK